jgi:ubiquinone/menaquinone biosynthesis C-methylase UbiE
MRNRDVTNLRASWIPRAHGDVLEVGIGSGLNLRFYTSEVHHVCGVDPSLELQQIARKRAANRAGIEFLSQSAEEPLPLKDESVDTVVSTWTLCSIPDPLKALKEMKRVLKKDGRFLFLEHGLSTDARVVAWQNRLTPMWKTIAGGCHLNRKMDRLIESAGFQITELKTEYLPGPRAMTFMYEGWAKRSDTPD